MVSTGGAEFVDKRAPQGVGSRLEVDLGRKARRGPTIACGGLCCQRAARALTAEVGPGMVARWVPGGPGRVLEVPQSQYR